MVQDGEVLGALIIPDDLATKLESGLEPGTVEVVFNEEDPPSAVRGEHDHGAVQKANAALTKRVAEEALQLLDLISDGGEYTFLGQEFEVLGLQKSEAILEAARADCPPARPSGTSSTG